VNEKNPIFLSPPYWGDSERGCVDQLDTRRYLSALYATLGAVLAGDCRQDVFQIIFLGRYRIREVYWTRNYNRNTASIKAKSERRSV